jgi:hypothetical protein
LCIFKQGIDESKYRNDEIDIPEEYDPKYRKKQTGYKNNED